MVESVINQIVALVFCAITIMYLLRLCAKDFPLAKDLTHVRRSQHAVHSDSESHASMGGKQLGKEEQMLLLIIPYYSES